MLKRIITLLSIALTLASSAVAKEKEGLKIGDPAPKFTLKDADDKEYSLEALLDKDESSIILLIGDRTVRKQANKWAIELDKIYGKEEEVIILMIADLRGLPFFVTEKMVKWGTKREKLPVPIVLDWGGKVSEQYKTQKGKSHLFIIDRDGKVSYRQAAPYSDELIKKVQEKVQDSLKRLLID